MVDSVVRARSEVEAAWMLAEGQEGTRVIAGGTDLVLQMELGRRSAKRLVDIRRAGMDGQRVSAGELRLGATRRVQDVLQDPLVSQRFPALHTAAAWFASLQIRNLATVGGNVGNASPAADLVPCLVAAGARAVVRQGDAQRELPLTGLFQGPGRTRLEARDLLTEIVVPLPEGKDAWTHQRFYKLGFRQAQVISVVNLCLLARVHGGVVEQASLALGSVAPTTVRAPRAEAFLTGKPLRKDTILEAASLALGDIKPMDDQRASAAYRREVARRYVCQALSDCLQPQAVQA